MTSLDACLDDDKEDLKREKDDVSYLIVLQEAHHQLENNRKSKSRWHTKILARPFNELSDDMYIDFVYCIDQVDQVLDDNGTDYK